MASKWHDIRDHLLRSSSTLEFQRNFQTIRRSCKPLAPYGDPAALLDALHRGNAPSERKNELLTNLVVASQAKGEADDAALTMMLLALWPAFDAVRRRSLSRRLGTFDDITSEVLARATAAIRDLDLQRVTWIAATIQRNVERDMVRARQREAARENLSSAIKPDDIPAEQAGCWPTVEDAHFGDDLRKLIGTDAGLVIRVAIDGFTQAEAAAELGISMEAARKRYQRAIHRLREALQKNV
jgi:RNA polymerase sigma-70 factor (ECF subfamily)